MLSNSVFSSCRYRYGNLSTAASPHQTESSYPTTLYVFILVPTLHKFWEKTKLHNNHVNWNASNMLSNLTRIRVKVKNNVSGNHHIKKHESENCNSGWSPVKKLFWICSFWKAKYFFLAPIGWKLNNYAFFPIAIKDWDVAVWAIRYFLWDHSLMKRKGRCRLPMNLSQTDT